MRKACYIFCLFVIIVSLVYCFCKAGGPDVDVNQDIYELPETVNECGQ